jgi:predicted MFS family arabinose efflux permease
MNFCRFKSLCIAAILALALYPHSLRACAACAGQSDSPMAKGMNWGIMSLLVVVACVLSGITAFFVYIAKKSSTDEIHDGTN